MISKFKEESIAYFVFLMIILLLIVLIIKEQNLFDVCYLILVIIYFVKFLLIKKSN